MPGKTFTRYLLSLQKKGMYVRLYLAVNCFKDPDLYDQHPLYSVEGKIVDVGDDYLLLDDESSSELDSGPNIIAIPFGNIAFVEVDKPLADAGQDS